MAHKSLMSKKKFKRTICHKCKTCEGNPSPTFCYKILYTNNSNNFVDELLPDILLDPSARDFMLDIDYQDFQDLICQIIDCKGCTKDKKVVKKCLMKFINQIRNGKSYARTHNSSILANCNKKTKKKDKIPAYATVMISDNEKFRERIKSILGNKNKQSDNN